MPTRAAHGRRLGPGGAIYQTNPDGKEWELFSTGFATL